MLSTPISMALGPNFINKAFTSGSMIYPKIVHNSMLTQARFKLTFLSSPKATTKRNRFDVRSIIHALLRHFYFFNYLPVVFVPSREDFLSFIVLLVDEAWEVKRNTAARSLLHVLRYVSMHLNNPINSRLLKSASFHKFCYDWNLFKTKISKLFLNTLFLNLKVINAK